MASRWRPTVAEYRIEGGLVGGDRGLNVPRPLVSEDFRTSAFDRFEALGCHIAWRDLLLGDRCGHIGIDESSVDADDKGALRPQLHSQRVGQRPLRRFRCTVFDAQ